MLSNPRPHRKLCQDFFISDIDLYLGLDSVQCEIEPHSVRGEPCFLISWRKQGVVISSTTSRKTQSDFQNISDTNEQNWQGRFFPEHDLHKILCPSFFYKLETIKLNPKIIQHTFRFSKKLRKNPQAIILSADTEVRRFKTNKKNPTILLD